MGERKINTENDLANLIIEYLRADGWTVYEEVRLSYGEPIADIVAERAGFLHVIETKMSLSLAVIEQAYHWTNHAHAVSIAFARFRPYKKYFYSDPKGQSIAMLMCRRLGVGMLKVTERENEYFENSIQIDTVERGAFHRPVFKHLHQHLRDELLAKGNAGTKGGGYWTPFKATCDKLRSVVNASPGITMREAIKQIDHHYARDVTAVACLSKYLNTGVLKGIRTKRTKKHIHLHPTND